MLFRIEFSWSWSLTSHIIEEQIIKLLADRIAKTLHCKQICNKSLYDYNYHKLYNYNYITRLITLHILHLIKYYINDICQKCVIISNSTLKVQDN